MCLCNDFKTSVGIGVFFLFYCNKLYFYLFFKEQESKVPLIFKMAGILKYVESKQKRYLVDKFHTCKKKYIYIYIFFTT